MPASGEGVVNLLLPGDPVVECVMVGKILIPGLVETRSSTALNTGA